MDIKLPLLSHCEYFITFFITHMGKVVKAIKHKDEDVPSSTNRLQYSTRTLQQQLQPAPKIIYFESLFAYIKNLYNDRPDSAFRFWSETELTRFLRWAIDQRSVALRCDYFDMLAAISKGSKCAQRAYELFNIGPQSSYNGIQGLSWAVLFKSIGDISHALSQRSDAEINPDGNSVCQL